MRGSGGLVNRLAVIAVCVAAFGSAQVSPTLAAENDKNWNIAFGMPVDVSGFDKGFLPGFTVDGLYGPYLTPPPCWRMSGVNPNWIEVTFAGKAQVDHVAILVGLAVKELHFDVLARLPDGKFDHLGTFNGKTDPNGIAHYDIPKPRGGITAIRIDGLDPTSPCIFEIEIDGRIGGREPVEVPSLPCLASPDTIFYGGTVITMVKVPALAQAVAILDGRIHAVGSTLPIRVMADPECTTEISLNHRTLMPGFIDAHSHVLQLSSFGATLEERQMVLLRNGVTTTGDLHTTPESLADITAFNAGGGLKVRTGVYMVYNNNCDDLFGTWFMAHPATHSFGEMLRINGVKMFADGTETSTCSKRPYFSFPLYEDTNPDEPFGDRFLSDTEIRDVTLAAQSLNLQVAIHAIGDAAIDDALNGIEMALDGGPNIYRHRIEHNAVVRPNQYARYGDIGIVATLPSTYPSCDPFGPPLPDEYLEWEWPFRALVTDETNAHFAWQADAPLHPQSPFHALYGYVTQKDLDDSGAPCEGVPPFTNPPYWIEDNDFTVQEGLEFMTTGAAYALFRETEVGSVEVGKLADLVVVSGNPFELIPDEFKDIAILVTLVGGRTEYCADGAGSLCP